MATKQAGGDFEGAKTSQSPLGSLSLA